MWTHVRAPRGRRLHRQDLAVAYSQEPLPSYGAGARRLSGIAEIFWVHPFGTGTFAKKCLAQGGVTGGTCDYKTFEIPAEYSITVQTAHLPGSGVAVTQKNEEPHWVFHTDPNYPAFGMCSYMRELWMIRPPVQIWR